jgi:hypothetical protein
VGGIYISAGGSRAVLLSPHELLGVPARAAGMSEPAPVRPRALPRLRFTMPAAEQQSFSWKIETKPTDQLELDDENPRLASTSEETDTQKALIKVLWDEMAVDEVALSIAANGFFQEEPLFVVPKGSPSRKFVVVEGNRRLAAVRLLRDSTLRHFVGAQDLPAISASARKQLDELPVSVYPDRKSLWEYFGFRHINGPQPWDAFAKAKYVADVHEDYGVALKEIARKIGDRHSIVQRLYNGYKVLQQAESRAGFSRDDAFRSRFYFSHLYTAVDYPEFRAFLGIPPDAEELRANPVPRGKVDDLKLLMRWIYGSKEDEVEPLVKSQNPDLNTLREVVKTDRGVTALRKNVPLYRAYEISVGDERRFRDSVTLAKENIQQAKATVTTGYKGDKELFEVVEDIVNVAQSVKDEMRPKRRGQRGS